MHNLSVSRGDLTCRLHKFTRYITWYKINEEDDLPKKGLWFLCKIRGSNDLSLVSGFENVIFEKYDAWAEVEAPF